MDLPSTSAASLHSVSTDTNNPPCLDIEVDVEIRPNQSPTRSPVPLTSFSSPIQSPPPSIQETPFLLRASRENEGFDIESSFSAHVSPPINLPPSENSVGHEKINIVLMGEGIGRTIISSSASIIEPVNTWPLATLSIRGKGFMAQDLTIINTANNGVAIDNWAYRSVFFRCKLEGPNATLHVQGEKQFYRSSHFYGKINMVSGYAQAFFQKCEFFGQKSYSKEKLVFSSQSPPLSTFKSVFIFHFCAFHVVGKYSNGSETTFLGGLFGDYASTIVMQSDLDASIAGYYFLDTSPPNTTYYAIFSNIKHGATMKNVPSFIHTISDAEVASEYSLRVFLSGDNWIPPGVDYDLDLAK
ncbi:hypothetical protein DH2020_037805 [Rehmannia glutinosa]|uniref:Pectinesterase catalytic domain-containing protein n=1 Tax=Rehmannia glutinosa TaxID=99300 RepID=A0ABR0V1M1_REHGL